MNALTSRTLYSIALGALVVALALQALVILSGLDIGFFNQNFALYSLINESRNPELIPQFDKLVFLTWGFCLERSTGTICKVADLSRQFSNVRFSFELPVPVRGSAANIEFMMLARPINNSLAFFLALLSCAAILPAIGVIAAFLLSSFRETQPGKGPRRQHMTVNTIAALAILTAVFASANLVMVMVVYGVFTSSDLVENVAQINENTLSSEVITEVGGYVFGDTFGLGTVLVGVSAGFALFAMMIAIRGVFVYRAEFEELASALDDAGEPESPSPFVKAAEGSFDNAAFFSPQKAASQYEQYDGTGRDAIQHPYNVGYNQPPPSSFIVPAPSSAAMQSYGQPVYYGSQMQPQSYNYIVRDDDAPMGDLYADPQTPSPVPGQHDPQHYSGAPMRQQNPQDYSGAPMRQQDPQHYSGASMMQQQQQQQQQQQRMPQEYSANYQSGYQDQQRDWNRGTQHQHQQQDFSQSYQETDNDNDDDGYSDAGRASYYGPKASRTGSAYYGYNNNAYSPSLWSRRDSEFS